MACYAKEIKFLYRVKERYREVVFPSQSLSTNRFPLKPDCVTSACTQGHLILAWILCFGHHQINRSLQRKPYLSCRWTHSSDKPLGNGALWSRTSNSVCTPPWTQRHLGHVSDQDKSHASGEYISSIFYSYKGRFPPVIYLQS